MKFKLDPLSPNGLALAPPEPVIITGSGGVISVNGQTGEVTLDNTYVNISGDTMTGDLVVPDEAYGVGWNDSLEVPTKNAVYDKLELFAAGTGIDHGGLTGLTDDDHTQYALLAGRSGGQTLIGGVASGDDLTLQSTANATKGSILFGTSEYDEVNNRLGINTTDFAPSTGTVKALRVVGDSIATSGTQDIATIGGTQSVGNTGQFNGASIYPVFTGGAGTTLALLQGLAVSPEHRGAGTITQINGVAGGPNVYSGTLTHGYGLAYAVAARETGTVTNGTGALAYAYAEGSGVIETAYGLQIYSLISVSSATTTTGYGIKIFAPIGNITTKYGLVIEDGAGNSGIGTVTPISLLDLASPTGGVLTLRRDDTTVTANDMAGKLQFYANDTSTSTNTIVANIEAQATNTITTNINPGRLIFRTTPTTVGASPTEAMRITEAQVVDINTTTGGILQLRRNDTTVTANDRVGIIQFNAADTSTSTNFIVADIEAQATNTVASNINPGRLIFRTTPTGVAATPTERMRITEAGDIGIGSTGTAGITAGAGPRLTLEASATNPYIEFSRNSDALADEDGVGGFAWYAGTARTAIAAMVGAVSGTAEDAGQYLFYTKESGAAISEKVRIDSDGSVGIGTTDPQCKLDVTTGATTSSEFHIGEAIDEGGWFTSIVDSQALMSGGVQYVSGNWTARATAATLLSIGAGAFIIYGDTGLTDGNTYSPTERMRVNTNGRVGINETSPDYQLDVNGTFGFTPGTSVTPVDNGDVVIEATDNTTLTFKLKGSDGTIRTATLTLA